MPSISGSVGKNGKNLREDAKTIQRLLNQQNLSPLRKLSVDGIVGPATIGAIEHFQSVHVAMKNPDGRVDPDGRTLRKLRNANSVSSTQSTNNENLSGTVWWRANQRKYPNSRRIDDLAGDFRDKVKNFVTALRDGGATVSISSTRRNKIRAHLMHYSWKVSRGQIAPDRVPQVSGLSIQWDHGDLQKSRKGASEMVRLFNMAHNASLTSNHIEGKAIDMTITWKGNLSVQVPGLPDPKIVSTGTRNGNANRELHRIGREFGVYKLVKDPPHWSHNGR